METYKTASALEGLFDLAKEDRLRIESVGHTPAYTAENEEYCLTIRIIRKKPEQKEPASPAGTDKTAQTGTNPKEQKTDSKDRKETAGDQKETARNTKETTQTAKETADEKETAAKTAAAPIIIP